MGPWGAMGPGGMGPWGAMGPGGMGPWGQSGPWNNPNLTAAEREKMMKQNPWGPFGQPTGPYNAPWMNPSLTPEEREKLLKSTPFESLGPWTDKYRSEKKNSNEKNFWKHGSQDTEEQSPLPKEPENVTLEEITKSQIEPVMEMNNELLQLAMIQQSNQGYIDPDTKYDLAKTIRSTVEDLRVLEDKRKNLSMRPDFS